MRRFLGEKAHASNCCELPTSHAAPPRLVPQRTRRRHGLRFFGLTTGTGVARLGMAPITSFRAYRRALVTLRRFSFQDTPTFPQSAEAVKQFRQRLRGRCQTRALTH